MKLLQIILCLTAIVTYVYANVSAVNFNETLGIENKEDNKHVVCVLMTFKHINITVYPNENQTHVNRSGHTKPNFFESYSADSLGIFEGKSLCENGSQRLVLNVSGNELIFDFTKYSKGYNLTFITYNVTNEGLFKNSSVRVGNHIHFPPELREKHDLDSGKPFFCRHRYNFTYDLTDSEKVEIVIKSLKFSAFRKTNSTNFADKPVECEDPDGSKPGNDIIPIAVGGVLTGFLILSLVAYLVIRSRKN